MRSDEETERTSPGEGELGCVRLHFERFEKLVISQFFTLQKFFFSFSKESTLLYNFLEW